jgi:hypothetical protein
VGNVRQSNIFYRIAKEDENSTTEMLVNLLRYKFFRDICLKRFGIPKKIYDNIDSENITTLNYFEDVGIPDICIKGDKSLYYVENKIRVDTDLQESQITTYPERIAEFKAIEHNTGGYIFLIPRGYIHRDKIDMVKKKYSFIKRIYWDKFLSDMSKLEIEKCSLIFKESLEYLRDVILGIPEDLTLTNYEVALMYNPKDIFNVLSLLEKNWKLIRKIKSFILEKYGDIFSFSTEQNDINGMGVHLNSTKGVTVFCGLNPCIYTEENGDYVYSLAFERKYDKEDLIEDAKRFPFFKDNNYVYIQLDRKLFIDESQEEKLKERIIEIIEEVLLKICK